MDMIFTMKSVFGDSVNCSPKSIEKLFPFKDTNAIIEYFQWETLMVERNRKRDYRTKKSYENWQHGRGYYSFTGCTCRF